MRLDEMVDEVRTNVAGLFQHLTYLGSQSDRLIKAVEKFRHFDVEDVFYNGDEVAAGAGEKATADVEVGPSKPGESWRVNQIACSASGSAKGSVLVYMDEIKPQNLIDALANVGSNAAPREYFVPQQRKLIFHFIEQTAGSVCSANVQITRKVRKP